MSKLMTITRIDSSLACSTASLTAPLQLSPPSVTRTERRSTSCISRAPGTTAGAKRQWACRHSARSRPPWPITALVDPRNRHERADVVAALEDAQPERCVVRQGLDEALDRPLGHGHACVVEQLVEHAARRVQHELDVPPRPDAGIGQTLTQPPPALMKVLSARPTLPARSATCMTSRVLSERQWMRTRRSCRSRHGCGARTRRSSRGRSSSRGTSPPTRPSPRRRTRSRSRGERVYARARRGGGDTNSGGRRIGGALDALRETSGTIDAASITAAGASRAAVQTWPSPAQRSSASTPRSSPRSASHPRPSDRGADSARGLQSRPARSPFR